MGKTVSSKSISGREKKFFFFFFRNYQEAKSSSSEVKPEVRCYIWLVYIVLCPRTPVTNKLTTQTGQTEALNCWPKATERGAK